MDQKKNWLSEKSQKKANRTNIIAPNFVWEQSKTSIKQRQLNLKISLWFTIPQTKDVGEKLEPNLLKLINLCKIETTYFPL